METRFCRPVRLAFQFGRFSRNGTEEGTLCWQVSDGEKTFCGLFHKLIPAGPEIEWLRVNGLDPDRTWHVEARSQLLRVGAYGSLLRFATPVPLDTEGTIIRLADRHYQMRDGGFSAECSGAALQSGIPLGKRFTGTGYDASLRVQGDFQSNVFCIVPKT